MIKRILSLFMAISLFACALSLSSYAFADDVTWRYDITDNTLYIEGTGAMDDYLSAYSAPWNDYILQCENVVIAEGVTSVGDYAFSGASNLCNVVIADTVTSIGVASFSSCPLLNSLSFSGNITSISDISFSKIGADVKPNFALTVPAGSFALNYAIRNGVNFDCQSVNSGKINAVIKSNTGMRAYFPYIAALSGTFVFYSVSKYDPVGFVYDESFNKLKENDDYSVKYDNAMDECDFSITVDLEQGKTYYFATELINPNLGAELTVYLLGKDFYLHGDIYAMADRSGALSNIKLYNSTMNGVATNGEYSVHVTDIKYTAAFEFEGASWDYTFSPDNGEECDIGIMICDLTGDRVVNAKDYAMMLKTNFSYPQLFYEFMNYKY